jgi:hypothetical protein
MKSRQDEIRRLEAEREAQTAELRVLGFNPDGTRFFGGGGRVGAGAVAGMR